MKLFSIIHCACNFRAQLQKKIFVKKNFCVESFFSARKFITSRDADPRSSLGTSIKFLWLDGRVFSRHVYKNRASSYKSFRRFDKSDVQIFEEKKFSCRLRRFVIKLFEDIKNFITLTLEKWSPFLSSKKWSVRFLEKLDLFQKTSNLTKTMKWHFFVILTISWKIDFTQNYDFFRPSKWGYPI